MKREQIEFVGTNSKEWPPQITKGNPIELSYKGEGFFILTTKGDDGRGVFEIVSMPRGWFVRGCCPIDLFFEAYPEFRKTANEKKK